jgi:hypothetical protein
MTIGLLLFLLKFEVEMLGTFLRLFIESEWKLTLVIFHKACFKTTLDEITVQSVKLYVFRVWNKRLTKLLLQNSKVVIGSWIDGIVMYLFVLLLFYFFQRCLMKFGLFFLKW